MKIAYKLYLVIAISLITVAGLGAVSYLGVKNIDARFDELVEFPIPSILRLGNMTEHFILIVEEAHSYRLYGSEESKKAYYEHAQEFDGLMSDLKQALHYGTPDIPAEDIPLIDNLVAKVAELNSLILADFSAYENDKSLPASLDDPYEEIKYEIVSLLDEYRNLESDEVQHARVEVDKVSDETTNIILFASLFLLFFIGLANGLFARSITKPLASLGEVAKGLGQGDLSKRVVLSRNDELGDLAVAFNAMADSVQQSHSLMEEEVKKRTAELEATKSDLEVKLSELEKMNTMMTGRELRMMELKKEVDELKSKISAT